MNCKCLVNSWCVLLSRKSCTIAFILENVLLVFKVIDDDPQSNYSLSPIISANA